MLKRLVPVLAALTLTAGIAAVPANAASATCTPTVTSQNLHVNEPTSSKWTLQNTATVKFPKACTAKNTGALTITVNIVQKGTGPGRDTVVSHYDYHGPLGGGKFSTWVPVTNRTASLSTGDQREMLWRACLRGGTPAWYPQVIITHTDDLSGNSRIVNGPVSTTATTACQDFAHVMNG